MSGICGNISSDPIQHAHSLPGSHGQSKRGQSKRGIRPAQHRDTRLGLQIGGSGNYFSPDSGFNGSALPMIIVAHFSSPRSSHQLRRFSVRVSRSKVTKAANR